MNLHRPFAVVLAFLLSVFGWVSPGSGPPGLAATSSAEAADVEAQPDSSGVAERLVAKLGDNSYQVRREAEAELTKSGLTAREALLAGLGSDDPEIRRSCQRILIGVLDADFARRLKAFVSDKEGKQEHDLPGWDRYRQIAGDDKEARELFAEMQRAESALLESAEVGVADAVELRLTQMYRMAYAPNSKQRKKPSRGTMAAIVFVCSDPSLELRGEEALRSRFVSLVSQGDFVTSLQKGPYQRPARALLGEWVRMPGAPQQLQHRLRFAVYYQLKEPGLDVALKIIEQKKAMQPSYVASAVETVARLGGKPYAAILTSLLDDERVCAQRTMVKNGKREQTEVHVRDVALAWLVQTTGQKHEDYLQKHAKQYHATLLKYPTQAFNFYNFVFEKPDDRKTALAKWATWAKANSLPEPPRTGPREIAIVVREVAKPAAEPGAAPANDVASIPASTRLEMADRFQVQRLSRARKLVEQEAFVEATQLLGEVLASPTDYCYQPDRGVPLFRQLKAEAEHILAHLPDKGREVYQLQYEPEARRLLTQAVATADMQAVAAVDRGFFFTPAGAEATYLLGTYHRFQGRFTQAAMYFERLRTLSPWAEQFEPSLSQQQAVCWQAAGFPEKARAAASRLGGDGPAASSSRPGAPANAQRPAEEILAALAEFADMVAPDAANWSCFRGNLSGNAVAEEGIPYLAGRAWAVFSEDSYLQKTVKQLQESLAGDRRTALLTLHPLVVDGLVLLRTATSIRAVDLSSGELVWEANSLNALWHLLRFGDAAQKQNQQSFVARGIQQRLWEDPSFGTLSSNGQFVFAVEDVGFELGPDYHTSTVRKDGRRHIDAGSLGRFNRLAAYDVGCGKLVWEIGGPATAKEQPLCGGRFIGPPLPLGDQLYVVVEFDDQTLLVALDASDGSPQQQWLLDAEMEATAPTGINVFGRVPSQPPPGRGVSPVFGEGILVCRTSKNRYAAVDLASRTVRWTFEPPVAEVEGRTNLVALQQQKLLQQLQSEHTDQWCDAGATIAEGHVLLTPLGTEKLHCLRASDGALLWSLPRRDGLFLAGVHAGKAIVVGREFIRAHNLKDGKSSWQREAVTLPWGAAPSGRGYLDGQKLYLPLSSAEVVTIDLDVGRIESRSRSPDGIVPGNLVRVDDYVVSLGPDGLRRFETLAARTERLAAAAGSGAESPQVMLDRAEILLYEGRVAEALELLQQAQQAAPSAEVAQLLSDAILQALPAGGPEMEQLATDVEKSLNDPELKAHYLERLATAYHDLARYEAAFDACWGLIDSGADGKLLVNVTAAHTVRRSRHIQGLLASICESADPQTRARFDEQINARLVADVSPVVLEYLAFHPAAQATRLQVADKLIDQKHHLEAELHLRSVFRRGSTHERAKAAARLAELLRSNGRPFEAARFYAMLAGRFEDAVVLNDKTGQQIVAALPSHSRVRGILSGDSIWPSGDVKMEQKKVSQSSAMYRSPLLLSHHGDPLAPDISVDIDVQKRKLLGHDAEGFRRWEADLVASQSMNIYTMQNYFLNEGRLAGHLLIAWSGQKIAAIDCLDNGKVLWTRDTSKLQTTNWWAMPLIRIRMQAAMQGQLRRSELAQPVVATTDYVAFQQDRILMALDPVSGDTLWIRDDLQRGSDLFGDRQRLVVTPADSDEAVVLSAFDGRVLGERKVPPREKRLGTVGSAVLLWDANETGTQLQLVDPWGQAAVWQHVFRSTAKPCLMKGGQVGVMDAEGRFVVVSSQSGDFVLDTSVDPLPELDSVFVRTDGSHFLLVANRPQPEQEGPVSWNRVPQGHIPVNGRVSQVDANSGKTVWKADVESQQLKMNYPSQAPVLTFFKYERKPVKVNNNSWRSGQPVVRVDCLDNRTGERLHSGKLANSSSTSYVMTVDPSKKQVEIESRSEKLSFLFTDGGETKQ